MYKTHSTSALRACAQGDRKETLGRDDSPGTQGSDTLALDDKIKGITKWLKNAWEERKN